MRKFNKDQKTLLIIIFFLVFFVACCVYMPTPKETEEALTGNSIKATTTYVKRQHQRIQEEKRQDHDVNWYEYKLPYVLVSAFGGLLIGIGALKEKFKKG